MFFAGFNNKGLGSRCWGCSCPIGQQGRRCAQMTGARFSSITCETRCRHLSFWAETAVAEAQLFLSALQSLQLS